MFPATIRGPRTGAALPLSPPPRSAGFPIPFLRLSINAPPDEEAGSSEDHSSTMCEADSDLHEAVRENEVDEVWELIWKGADINSFHAAELEPPGLTVLMKACMLQHIEIVLILLSRDDINVNAVTQDGLHQTALILAIRASASAPVMATRSSQRLAPLFRLGDSLFCLLRHGGSVLISSEPRKRKQSYCSSNPLRPLSQNGLLNSSDLVGK